ncbi:hypothetical protein HUT19_28275 [Streptomyces sp. NA02950]|uniref:hypothetical protein n=1 Tax=Streptomyces sp. NA02950 TaxID=2742137 RepID=UPI0015911DC2|nr:hypothetical protein [Streptomyces sp. NA02950]QKV95155.1 hypothetical protein HUT19_28275 [Streptomyces sp. NA02950]
MASYDPRPSALAALCAALFALERPECPEDPEGPGDGSRAGDGAGPAGVRRAVLGRAAAAFAVLCVTVALAALCG